MISTLLLHTPTWVWGLLAGRTLALWQRTRGATIGADVQPQRA